MRPLNRRQYLDTVHASNLDGAWGVWLVVGLAAALGAGAAIVAVAVAGVPRLLTGFPLVVPLELTGGPAAGAAILGLLAAAVTTRLALRASPADAMRGRE